MTISNKLLIFKLPPPPSPLIKQKINGLVKHKQYERMWVLYVMVVCKWICTHTIMSQSLIRDRAFIIVIGDRSLKKNLLLVIFISVKAVYKKNHQVKLIIRKQLIDRPVSNIYNKQSLAAYYGGQSVHARIRSNRP